jgi:hypothetical protein
MYWMPRTGVSFGDETTLKLPFARKVAMLDDSYGYFTRKEYMSYGRNRTDNMGMTYGDDLLGKAIEAYYAPELEYTILSDYIEDSEHSFTISSKEKLSFRIEGKTYSGLRALGITTHKEHPDVIIYDPLTRQNERVYDAEGGREFEDRFMVVIKFPSLGTHQFRCYIEDLLEPIRGHLHKQEIIITVRVVE